MAGDDGKGKGKITAQGLARLIHEELERHAWGDIDPYFFKMIAEGIDKDDDNANDARDLEELLERVVARLDVDATG